MTQPVADRRTDRALAGSHSSHGEPGRCPQAPWDTSDAERDAAVTGAGHAAGAPALEEAASSRQFAVRAEHREVSMDANGTTVLMSQLWYTPRA